MASNASFPVRAPHPRVDDECKSLVWNLELSPERDIGPVPRASRALFAESVGFLFPPTDLAGLFASQLSITDSSVEAVQELHRIFAVGASAETATQCLNEIGRVSFDCRKNPNSVVYSHKILLDLCKLGSRYRNFDDLQVKQIHLDIEKTQHLILKFMDRTERKELLRLLGTEKIVAEPMYRPLREFCFKKYYLPVDCELTDFISPKKVLFHVLKRASQRLARNPLSETYGKVCEYADSLLKKIHSGEDVSVDYLFHMTPNLEDLPSIVSNGVQVTHQSKYPGAFVSDGPEISFGEYGVVVGKPSLASKGSLTRSERRSSQDGGSVWLGSNVRVTPEKRVVIISQKVTPLRRQRLADRFQEMGVVPQVIDVEVMRLFYAFAKELGHYVPVPPMTSQRDLAFWSERDEDLVYFNKRALASPT